MSLSSGPDELSEEEVAWNKQWEAMRKLRDELKVVAEVLIEKGKISGCDNFGTFSQISLPGYLVKKTGKSKQELGKYAAFHPFIGSGLSYGQREFFDTPEKGIENAARELLAKLEKANASEDTTPIEL